jgi:hypothetical protein
MQRTEIGRVRILYFLSIILGTTAVVTAWTLYSQVSENSQLALVLLGIIGLAAVVLSLIQLYAFPKRSHALLVHRGTEMILATNALHEGFKLRFLRDVMSENVASLSDEERARWKFLEADGYYPALYIRNPKKLLVLRLCTMLFDDVFAVDASNRWEHHDCASTSEPTFARGDKPRLRAWPQNN